MSLPFHIYRLTLQLRWDDKKKPSRSTNCSCSCSWSCDLLSFFKISTMFYSRIQAEIFQDRSQSGNMPLHISTQGNDPITAKLIQQTFGIFRWKSGRYRPFFQLLWPNSWGQQRTNKVISPVTSVKETWSYCCGHVKSLLMSVFLAVITYSISWNLFAVSLKMCRLNIFSHFSVSTDF